MPVLPTRYIMRYKEFDRDIRFITVTPTRFLRDLARGILRSIKHFVLYSILSLPLAAAVLLLYANVAVRIYAS